VADGRDFVERNAWIVASPSVVISLLMLAFTFSGTGCAMPSIRAR
jgi:ABC-type dipeptide/oligopeptide/nickel transport system permease subunit